MATETPTSATSSQGHCSRCRAAPLADEASPSRTPQPLYEIQKSSKKKAHLPRHWQDQNRLRVLSPTAGVPYNLQRSRFCLAGTPDWLGEPARHPLHTSNRADMAAYVTAALFGAWRDPAPCEYGDSLALQTTLLAAAHSILQGIHLVAEIHRLKAGVQFAGSCEQASLIQELSRPSWEYLAAWRRRLLQAFRSNLGRSVSSEKDEISALGSTSISAELSVSTQLVKDQHRRQSGLQAALVSVLGPQGQPNARSNAPQSPPQRTRRLVCVAAQPVHFHRECAAAATLARRVGRSCGVRASCSLMAVKTRIRLLAPVHHGFARRFNKGSPSAGLPA